MNSQMIRFFYFYVAIVSSMNLIGMDSYNSSTPKRQKTPDFQSSATSQSSVASAHTLEPIALFASLSAGSPEGSILPTPIRNLNDGLNAVSFSSPGDSFCRKYPDEAYNMLSPILFSSSDDNYMNISDSYTDGRTSTSSFSTLNSSFSFDSCQSPVLKIKKQTKKVKTSAASSSTEHSSFSFDSYKSPTQDINERIEKGSKMLSADRETIKRKLDEFVSPTRGSKLKLAEKVASAMYSSLKDSPVKTNTGSSVKHRDKIETAVDAEVQDNQIMLDIYRNCPGYHDKNRRLKTLEHAVGVGGTPLRNKYMVVDSLHSKKPDIKKRDDGTIKQILGGHDFSEYASENLADSCFISADGNAIGIYVETVTKTVGLNFDHKKIIDTAKQSKVIAKKGTLEICIDENQQFFGRFRSDRCGLINTSIFPIIVVNDDSSDSDEVELGTFGTISSDRSNFNLGETVTVSRDVLDSMKSQGNPFTSDANFDGALTEITVPVMNHIQDKLTERGLPKFFPVYLLSSNKP